MDLNNLSLEDICKLKCEVLHIKVEYKLSNKEIKKKVNEECDLGVGFDDAFKVHNHIFFNYIKDKWKD